MTLMAGYAAAMDASMSGASEGNSSEALPSETVAEPSVLEPTESLVGANGTDHVEDWESQAGEDPDVDKTSLCISETSSKKGKGEGEKGMNFELSVNEDQQHLDYAEQGFEFVFNLFTSLSYIKCFTGVINVITGLHVEKQGQWLALTLPFKHFGFRIFDKYVLGSPRLHLFDQKYNM